MHRATLLAALLFLAVGSTASLPAQTPAAPPAGWSIRPDGDATPDQVHFTSMKTGYHVSPGEAAALLYRAADDGKGPFHTLATFTQVKAPQHPEGYGLFYGGQALTDTTQRYTYFLVRGDGKYLIKRREGDKIVEVKPWTAHPAIKTANAKGQVTNLVEIEAKRDSKKVVFMANGQVIHSMDAEPQAVDGVVGLRVNHDLDLHIEGFGVHR